MTANNIHRGGGGTLGPADMQVDIVPGTDVLRDAEDRHLKHGRRSDTMYGLSPVQLRCVVFETDIVQSHSTAFEQ